MIEKISVVALSKSEAKKALINSVTADDLTSLSALNCVCVCSLFLSAARHVCGVQLICASVLNPTHPVGTESYSLCSSVGTEL